MKNDLRNFGALKLGVVGCGTISGAYFRAARTFPILEITACADLNPTAAAQAARTWGVDALSVEALLAREDIKIILNLTVPQAHAAVTLQALEAGKHVHLEKPLALSREEGRRAVSRAHPGGQLRASRRSGWPDGRCGRLYLERALGRRLCRTLRPSRQAGGDRSGAGNLSDERRLRWGGVERTLHHLSPVGDPP